jgi:flavin-dependent dehydrogenase
MRVDPGVGAEVREGFAVSELIVEDGIVRGIRGHDSEERAEIVIGADGRNSFVARSVRAPEYHQRPSLTCGYYSYFSGVDLEGVELYPREGGASWPSRPTVASSTLPRDGQSPTLSG